MRVLATMRVDLVQGYGEVRDALDQAWHAAAEQIFGPCAVFPVPNAREAARDLVAAVQPNALLLTGGNDLACCEGAIGVSTERDAVECMLLDWARARSRAVFGACRGLQHLNVYLGGRLAPCEGHVAVCHPVHVQGASCSYEVNSFHGIGIPPDGLAPPLRAWMVDDRGWVEAAAHRELPWLGVMWHPERDGPCPAPDGIRQFYASHASAPGAGQ